MQLLSDRIAVLVDEPAESKTHTGIILTDVNIPAPNTGLVVYTGPGRYVGETLIPVSVDLRDRVVFNQFAGTKMQIDGQELLILRENEIIAVL